MATPGCTKSTCPASDSIYGYQPSLAATVIFLVLFALSGVSHLVLARKAWFFGSAMALGCAFEVLGYVAKLLLWNDPFSDAGFKMSVVCLTLAPAFFSAGIYYTLKHLTLTVDPSLNRFNPSWYTWIFISCDLFSIILQAIGGAIGAAATNDSLLNASTGILITGLVTQVVTLLVFGLCVADYARRVRQKGSFTESSIRASVGFKLFLAALSLAYLMILLRCAYRVAELSKGWGTDNYILREQDLFIGLDSVPCAIATILLNIWHPGWYFLGSKKQHDRARKASDPSSADEAAIPGDIEKR